MQRSSQVESLVLRVVAGSDAAGRLQALCELRRELDAIESELAADAVRSGMSWRQIGAAIGVSKQAAHRRHRDSVTKAGTDPQPPDAARNGGVVISIHVRRAVRMARHEAARVGSNEVGTEHLLLGILQSDDDQVISLLRRNDVTLEAAREAVEITLGHAGDPYDQGEQSASLVSPLARRIVQRALAHAAARDSRELTTLDLLGSIVMHDDAGATRTLARLGVDMARLRADIISPTRNGLGVAPGA